MGKRDPRFLDPSYIAWLNEQANGMTSDFDTMPVSSDELHLQLIGDKLRDQLYSEIEKELHAQLDLIKLARKLGVKNER